MIQAWLAKNALQLGVAGVIILAIFFTGWRVNGKRLHNKMEDIKSNYAQCLEQNEIAVQGLEDIKDALEEQNAAFTRIEQESAEALEKQKRIYLLALQQEREKTARILKEKEVEIRTLRKKFEGLTASEACHEAWLELTK